MRDCPLTNSSEWIDLYESKTDLVITGDQRIIEGKLHKVICSKSGIVANKTQFSDKDIEHLYGKEYELNTIGTEEHFYYTEKDKVPRSKAFFDWISPHMLNYNSITEIGCGEGNLLQRFNNAFPNKLIKGFDGSFKAISNALDKGLDVEQKVVLGQVTLPKSDVYFSVNVIEHIENLDSFIGSIKVALNKDGIIVFCLPIQDYGGYDIFFHEHVWHFTAQHFEWILKKNKLELIHKDINHPIHHGIGLFVCKINNDISLDLNEIKYNNIIKETIEKWENYFINLNKYLLNNKDKKIAIFGAGEVATLFLAFTDLLKYNVVVCIDDTKREGYKKHGIEVHNSLWLEENQIDCLLLTVNEKYNAFIQEKLKHLAIEITSVFDVEYD